MDFEIIKEGNNKLVVKRLSDGQVFRYWDKVREGWGMPGYITGFHFPITGEVEVCYVDSLKKTRKILIVHSPLDKLTHLQQNGYETR